MRGRNTSNGDARTVGSRLAPRNSHSAGTPLRPQPPRKQPAQERSRHTVDAILEAATRVFDHEGAGATTNRIAEVAGVGIGSLYQYFPNKQALLTALHERHLDEVADAVLDALDGAAVPLRDTIARLVQRSLAVHRHRPALQRMLHLELPQLAQHDSASPAKQRVAQQVHRWLESRAGALGIGDAALATRTLLTVGEGLVHQAVLNPPPGVSDTALADEIARALCGYLTEASTRKLGPEA
ncbi:TetR/AcrR family transcriptional regulator [Schlegelella sp. S2-27]|uniref:TetR/AcrR family transcriptional regulator n=1 Tax=Caldimonas mangrovi TaxID=2944811 RepID=A0ABT0YTZ8_9BURK|nr:TetR/AcrR family transcriptional regulator [Caldimonas mangrovi]MCM5682224.1 TetR/AcrR family transcriptional regulator [Caldimonas mangrovi]